MKQYELVTESMNPCGGEEYAIREFADIETESPEAYVAAHGRMPVLNIGKNSAGDVVITTGNGHGYIVRYTFTE